jgi:Na+/proline symporter
MAGVFSSADSQINCFCAMFTNEIYKKLFVRDKNKEHYLFVSKVAGVTFTLAAIGTALLFSVGSVKDGMMLFAFSVLATIMPPFGAVTILGSLTDRVNKYGAVAGIIAGVLVSVLLIVADAKGYLKDVASVTIYIRTLATFMTSAIVAIIVSLAIPAPRTDGVPSATYTKIKFTPTTVKLSLMLIAALIIMASIWTYVFCIGPNR